MRNVHRWEVIRAVFWRSWAKIAGAIVSVLGVLDIVEVRVVPLLPGWSWQTWVTVFAVFVAVVAVEGAYRYARALLPVGADLARYAEVVAALARLSAEERTVLRLLVTAGRADAPAIDRQRQQASGNSPGAGGINDSLLRINATTAFLQVEEMHNGHQVWGVKDMWRAQLHAWLAQPERFGGT